MDVTLCIAAFGPEARKSEDGCWMKTDGTVLRSPKWSIVFNV